MTSFPGKGNRGEAFSILQNDSKEKRNDPGMATCLTTVIFGQKLHEQLKRLVRLPGTLFPIETVYKLHFKNVY